MQWDRHAKKTIEGISMPEAPVHFSEMCKDEIFCGLPIFSTRSLLMGWVVENNFLVQNVEEVLIHRGQWLPSSTPKFPDISLIDSHSKINLSDNRVKISFTSNGTSLSAIFIRPRQAADLVSWSFSDEVPDTFNKTYFVSIANGFETEPLKFDLTLKTEGRYDGPLLDITLISIKFDRKNDYTADYKKILERVPDWAFAMNCIAAVTGYVY